VGSDTQLKGGKAGLLQSTTAARSQPLHWSL